MSIRKDYYVYAYLRKSDNTPYYIGKGTGYRINQKSGHPFLPAPERRVKLAENLTEQAAFDLEIELISKYGRKKYDEGGILYNTTLGGEGASIHKTEESRQAVIRAYKESDRYQEIQKKNRKIRQERLRADTEDGRMRRKKKSESDKRYRKDSRYRDKILQNKKEYYEENREEILRKMREYRATPEAKEKKAFMDKRYAEQVKKDPEKLERRRKISRESALRNSRKRGVKPREECGRKFKVVSPEGKVYEGINCRPFAKEHDLHPQSFTAMVRGELNHCSGWIRYGFEPPEGYKWNGKRFDKIHKQCKNQRSFKVIDPEGKIWEGKNQSLFCDEHGLDRRKLNAVLLGKRKSHKGWTRVEETEQNSSVDLMQFFE